MDLRDWQKIAEDEKTVTMKHAKGHSMTIAIKALPKIQQEAIKRLKMAHGGGVSEQGKDIRYGNKMKMLGDNDKHTMSKDMAKEEARGRAAEERHVKPNIQGLAEGGEVDPKVEHLRGVTDRQNAIARKNHPERSEESKARVKASFDQADRLLKSSPVGGKHIHNYDDGGRVPAPSSASSNNSPTPIHNNELDNAGGWSGALSKAAKELGISHANGGKVQYFEDKGEVEPEDAQSPHMSADDSSDQASGGTTHNSPVTVNVGVPQSQPVAAATPAPAASAPVVPESSQIPVATPTLPQAPANQGLSGQAQTTLNANTQAKQAQDIGQGIESQQAKIAADADAQRIAGEQKYLQGVQAHHDAMKQHTDEFAEHLKTVNPSNYLKEMGTGSKIATGIGLFLGGLGTPFGGHNYASDFLDKQIDRDIDAQKANNEKQKTIWGAYKDLYQNDQIADALTKVSMNDLQKQQLDLGSARLGTAQALKNAAERKAKLDMDSEQQRYKAASIAGGANGLSSRQETSGGSGENNSFKEREENPNVYKILSPGAASKYQQIMGGLDPLWSPKSELVNQQYTQAQQAEKVLNGPKNDGVGGIHDILQQMQAAQKNMGYYGHAHSKLKEMGEALPIVGGAAGAATGLIPDTHSEKRFNALKASLEGDIASALNGIMTPSDIHKLIEHYAPAYQDQPEDIKFKEQNIVNTITKALRSGSLSSTGMLRN